MTARVFVLSPASCGGERAQFVLDEHACFDLARRLRTRDGAPLGEVMSFLSGLYFRGKLAYALRFACPPVGVPGVLVITPCRGLKPPETRVDLRLLRRYAAVSINAANAAYRRPLVRDARELARALRGAPPCEVVLLGSVATGKYGELLGPAFGERLVFPPDFVGRGDMSRGGLLLRCVDEGRELDYIPLAGAVRHGARPPRLSPRPGILRRAIGRAEGMGLARTASSGGERVAGTGVPLARFAIEAGVDGGDVMNMRHASRCLVVGILAVSVAACSTAGSTGPFGQTPTQTVRDHPQTVVGAGVGAASGAVVGGRAGGTKGAVIGGLLGALAGGAVGNYVERREASAPAGSVSGYPAPGSPSPGYPSPSYPPPSYPPAQGHVVRLEQVQAWPQEVRPGTTVNLNATYTVLTPYNQALVVRETREVRWNGELVANPALDVTRQNGTYTTTLPIILPPHARLGRYEVTTTVALADRQSSSTTTFYVQ